MTLDQSKQLKVGTRVCFNGDQADRGFAMGYENIKSGCGSLVSEGNPRRRASLKIAPRDLTTRRIISDDRQVSRRSSAKAFMTGTVKRKTARRVTPGGFFFDRRWSVLLSLTGYAGGSI